MILAIANRYNSDLNTQNILIAVSLVKCGYTIATRPLLSLNSILMPFETLAITVWFIVTITTLDRTYFQLGIGRTGRYAEGVVHVDSHSFPDYIEKQKADREKSDVGTVPNV